jgi:hypothetical protein
MKESCIFQETCSTRELRGEEIDNRRERKDRPAGRVAQATWQVIKLFVVPHEMSKEGQISFTPATELAH